MKNKLSLILCVLLSIFVFVACSPKQEVAKPAETTKEEVKKEEVKKEEVKKEEPKKEEKKEEAKAEALKGEINVITREEGSGTRGAFVDILNIKIEIDGKKVDNITDSASVKNNTAGAMTAVQQNKSSIGYISYGSLNEMTKALNVNGVEISSKTIADGSYEISRPFNIATKEEDELTKDYIEFIFSKEGQSIVLDNKYIPIDDSAPAYESKDLSGKLVVEGSSSISPLMEKIKEAYEALNPNVTVEVQSNDSSTGVQSAIKGLANIGMASRDLKESELSEGLTNYTIAIDGIAIIINNENPMENIDTDTLKAIFEGNVTTWEEIK